MKSIPEATQCFGDTFFEAPRCCEHAASQLSPRPSRHAGRAGAIVYGGQNPIPLVNIKIAGKWMFIPLKMVCIDCIGIDP